MNLSIVKSLLLSVLLFFVGCDIFQSRDTSYEEMFIGTWDYFPELEEMNIILFVLEDNLGWSWENNHDGTYDCQGYANYTITSSIIEVTVPDDCGCDNPGDVITYTYSFSDDENRVNVSHIVSDFMGLDDDTDMYWERLPALSYTEYCP